MFFFEVGERGWKERERESQRKLMYREVYRYKNRIEVRLDLIGRRDVRRMTKTKSMKVRRGRQYERENSSGSLGYRQTHAGATPSVILPLSWPTGTEQEGMRALSHVH